MSDTPMRGKVSKTSSMGKPNKAPPVSPEPPASHGALGLKRGSYRADGRCAGPMDNSVPTGNRSRDIVRFRDVDATPAPAATPSRLATKAPDGVVGGD